VSVLNKPYFQDEAAAFTKLESIVWPNGPTCPKCGAVDRIGSLDGVKDKKGRVRPGLKKCYHCRSQFTVRVGTVFESSHIPLHKWLQAAYLMAASKKGISAHQLHRTLEIAYKSAWFMAHRLREAMASGDLSPFGSTGGAVEVDETFIGRKKGKPVRHGYEHKHKVLSLVDRQTGRARSMVMDELTTKSVAPIVRANVAREARLMTDEAKHYIKVGREYADHQRVYHSTGEYGRGDAHTNTIEGFFSIFKRGMKGVYQHCGEQHLHRYLAEFDFRYTNRIALGTDDAMRTETALRGIVGKRLKYRDSSAAE
jgi:transposase-like protein